MLRNAMQAAGAVAPDFDIVAAIPNVVHSTFETTPNSTLQFAWGAAAGSFDSQEEALAAFQQFLTTVCQPASLVENLA